MACEPCNQLVGFCCTFVVPEGFTPVQNPEDGSFNYSVAFNTDCLFCNSETCETEMTIPNPCPEDAPLLCPVTLNRLVAQGSIRYIASLEVMDSQGNISHICCHGESCVDNILLYTCQNQDPCEGFDPTNVAIENATVEPANCTNACDTILTLSGEFDLLCEPSTATFSNTASITINNSGPATPYPSTINVSGMEGTISKVTVTLDGFSHTWPSDVDVMLVAPNGTNTILMSDPDLDEDVTNLTLTFDDSAVNLVPCGSTLTSGTYKPTNCGGGDSFPLPAPMPNPVVALSNFNGGNPNGDWRLFVVDDIGGDSGSISNGWSITITTTC
jgi:subtilisin-like proprotein convertase family protein